MSYICKKHPDKIQQISFNTLTQDHGCYYCGLEINRKKRLKTQEQFQKEVFELVGNEYVPLEVYNGEKNKIKFLHNTSNPHTFIMSPNCFLKGQRCSVCSSNQIFVGINDMWSTASEMAKLLLNKDDGYKYMAHSTKKIYWRCPYCKNIIYKSPSMVYDFGLSCKNCSDTISYPNKLMHNILKQLNVDFIAEYSPDWIKPKRYDFYIPSLNLIIEMDGNLGHGKDNIFYGISGEKFLLIDKYKDETAKEHGIIVVRIDCRGKIVSTIKRNIIKQLNLYLDVNQIDWKQCNKYALTPVKHEIIKLWNSGLSVGEICEKIKCSKNIVYISLRNGKELDICSYSNSEIKSRSAKKNKVICLNNKRIFNSSTEAARWCGLKSLRTYNVFPSETYRSSGKHPITKERLYWMKYKEYLKINDEDIDKIINYNIANSKKVVCLNNRKIFYSIIEAGKWCGLKDVYAISAQIKGKLMTAGKNPVTNEPLRWMFYEDYLKIKGELL